MSTMSEQLEWTETGETTMRRAAMSACMSPPGSPTRTGVWSSSSGSPRTPAPRTPPPWSPVARRQHWRMPNR
jgi:hypothetical protein